MKICSICGEHFYPAPSTIDTYNHKGEHVELTRPDICLECELAIEDSNSEDSVTCNLEDLIS